MRTQEVLKKENIPAPVRELLRALRQAGYEAYPVGGCVRDLLLGVSPHDWDMTTAATPCQAETALTGWHIVETGIKHGTITVLAGEYPVELTTFRGESGYADGRHPDHVTFGVTLQEDLARRDFTIGAMAWDTEKDCLIDPFGGQRDLENRLIRAVGDPDRRFAEDGLRILRGLRFAATLGFAIEPETAAAMRRNADRLRGLSPERVRGELEKLLCGKAAVPVLRDDVDIIGAVLPELLPMVGFRQNNPHHCKDGWEHTLTVLQNVPPEPELRWAALLHDVEKPACCTVDEAGIRHFKGHQEKGAQTAERILRRLHCETRFITDVTELIRIHDIRFPATTEMATRWAGRWGERRFLQFLALRRADTLGQAHPEEAEPYDRAMREAYAEAKRQNACFTVRQLAVSGDDLTGLGLSGPAVGEALRQLLRTVQSGALPNERSALLAAAREPKKG